MCRKGLKMIYIRPEFFSDFKCIAEKCTDSCCIGWEIGVDSNTKEKYEKIKTPFGKKVMENIVKSEDGGAVFKLGENERCPFLNDNNLCDIIINCGEENICYICKEHPRFYNDYANATEYGLGLCCEEVCRLLIETDEPLNFLIEEYEDEDICFEYNEFESYKKVYALREKIYEILKLDISYNNKIQKIIDFIEIEFNEKPKLLSDEELLKAYKNTEPINNEWVEYFNSLYVDIKRIQEKEKPFDISSNGDKKYSKILSYIVFRHLMNSIYTDSFSLVKCLSFCISSVRFIKLCDIKSYIENGELTLSERINNIKRWSKQIEYSDENINILTSV